MNPKVMSHTKKVCFALIICLSASVIWMVPGGLYAEGPGRNEMTIQAQALIATRDTQKLQRQLQEWRLKAEACNPQSSDAHCQALFEAIELVQAALNEE